ncbi:hypothetical protein MSAS_18300 [Mycobacterium saskatchewanense]|nr:hypothetical protein MSAS_18300 [Mycobacterium saskatchewanense]
MRSLREPERRAIDLPVIGKFHGPDKHDAVYVAGLAALLVVGAVELPVALVATGGHVLVKQHSSRSLSAIGEVMEDVFGRTSSTAAHPPRASINAERFTLVAAVRGMTPTNSTVFGAL